MSDEKEVKNAIAIAKAQFNTIKQFIFVLAAQTICLLIFWNAFVVTVFNEMKYGLDILSSLYLVLAYKSLTLSFVSLMNFATTSTISNDISYDIYERKLKEKLIYEMMTKKSSGLVEPTSKDSQDESDAK
jgi:hypothetical protein